MDLLTEPIIESDRIRFWAKVNRHGPVMPEMETPCWLWTAGKDHDLGYGRFRLHGKQQRAHRIAFVLSGGVFTEAKPQANHRCHNRVCCNPDHMYAGNQLENVRDMVEAGTLSRARGEKNGSAKLTDAQCDYIRSSLLSQTAIARELGVNQSQISLIRNGKSRNSI